jgi:hypothetical protein
MEPKHFVQQDGIVRNNSKKHYPRPGDKQQALLHVILKAKAVSSPALILIKKWPNNMFVKFVNLASREIQ